MKKLLFLILIFSFFSINLVSQEYKICLGTFNDVEKARQLVSVLSERGIPTSILESKKDNNETSYQILSEEILPNRQSAIFQKELFLNHPIIKQLNINEVTYVPVKQSSNFQSEEINQMLQETQTELQDLKRKMQGTQSELQKTQKELQQVKADLNKALLSLQKIQKNQQTATIKKTPVPAPTPAPKPVAKEKPVESDVTNKQMLLIRDSDTGLPIPDADVNIDEIWMLKSNSIGQVDLPVDIPEGEHKVFVNKGSEYVPTEGSFTVAKGEVVSTPQVSIPKAVDFDRIKIILDWAEFPWDLDAHAVDGENHVFFSEKKQGNLELDRDDVTSYGPETITIIEPKSDKVYSYYVYDCSNSGNSASTRLSNSQAQVRVYFGNEFKTSFEVPKNKKGLTWHVFDVVDGNKIIPKNKISSKMPSEY